MKSLKVLGITALLGFMCMTTLNSCGDDKPSSPKKEQPDKPDQPTKKPEPKILGEGWAIPIAPMTNFEKSGYEVYDEIQKYCKENNLTFEQKEQIAPEGDEPGVVQYDLVVNKNPDFPVFQYFFSYKIKEGTTNEAELIKLVGVRTLSPNTDKKMAGDAGISDFVKNSLNQMGFIELKKYDPDNLVNGQYWNEKLGIKLVIGDIMYGDWPGFPTFFHFSPAKERPQV